MKTLDKIILKLFSILILFESILMICFIMNWVSIVTIQELLTLIIINDTAKTVTLVVSILCLICSFKCIFFGSPNQDNVKKGVLMENDNGKLLISSDTIVNIVTSTVKGFDSISDVAVSTNLEDSENIIINIDTIVNRNVIIKELTLNMQNKIKEAVKRTLDLEVKEVNVRIENIATEEKEM